MGSGAGKKPQAASEAPPEASSTAGGQKPQAAPAALPEKTLVVKIGPDGEAIERGAGVEEATQIFRGVIPSAAPVPGAVVEEAMDEGSELPPKPTIALIAHDGMKPLLKDFVTLHMDELRSFNLTGTGTSCAVLREAGFEPVGGIVSGPLGGDQQIGAMIVKNEITAVFFFRDPLFAHPHNADIEALGRLADCYQEYFATNYRTACAVLNFMHNNLKAANSSNSRASIKKPEGVDDMAERVQATYKATRAMTLGKVR
eukprot:CAMPEP_0179077710 /NCGR_PEP_ID=MMETSP0796-20121207/34754_1 /TAXON_ID=73915 /ORGANISM="Pyrodinium bahamense, Strain pbaha01" /LENGTH=256 /DNA_ID=CAMNT_0020774997 /DNA_START=18 /DNA_END=788 /DNA_ORIENTATION=+